MEDAYLLDTGVASIAWDGEHPNHTEVRQRLAQLGEASISVCAVTVAEVLYGLVVSPRVHQERHDAVKHALWQYRIWDVNRHTAQVCAPMRGRLFEKYSARDKRGRLTAKWLEDLWDTTTAKELGIQENDLWIVSVAVQYDLGFITADTKLQRITDIAMEVHGYDRAIVWSFE